MHRNTAPSASTSSAKRRPTPLQEKGPKRPRLSHGTISGSSPCPPLICIDDQSQDDDEIQILHHSPPSKKPPPLNGGFLQRKQRGRTVAIRKSLVNKSQSRVERQKQFEKETSRTKNSANGGNSLARNLSQYLENAREKVRVRTMMKTAGQNPARVQSQLKGPLRTS